MSLCCSTVCRNSNPKQVSTTDKLNIFCVLLYNKSILKNAHVLCSQCKSCITVRVYIYLFLWVCEEEDREPLEIENRGLFV